VLEVLANPVDLKNGICLNRKSEELCKSRGGATNKSRENAAAGHESSGNERDDDQEEILSIRKKKVRPEIIIPGGGGGIEVKRRLSTQGGRSTLRGGQPWSGMEEGTDIFSRVVAPHTF